MTKQVLHSTDISTQPIWSILSNIMDPEVPVLSILDLGIVRSVAMRDDEVDIVITPTYTGCPAMDVISMSVRMELLAAGYAKVNVQQLCSLDLFVPDEAVQCPHCQWWHTRRISEFGSTACKSLFQCNDCHEPFDYFKCH